MTDSNDKISKSEEQWREELGSEQFHICREQGTERPFTGRYWDHHEDGVYRCACCGAELFDSQTKYESGSGWPSFWKAIDDGRVATHVDRSHGMVRTEITCARCDCHLGHLFEDGPEPTGLRYCTNSASLSFVPRGDAE